MTELPASNGQVETAFARSVAFEVIQTFGSFFVAKFPAGKLLEVCFVEELQATMQAKKADYGLKGTQRQRRKPKIADIARFINSIEAAFPNTIILAANYQEDGTLLEPIKDDPDFVD